MALGKTGWERQRAGDITAAETAFLTQIAIYPGNPDPHVALALLAASRKDEDAALDRLRAAIIRGFTDLPRVERAELWIPLRLSTRVLDLEAAVPAVLKAEKRWASWGAYRAPLPPESVAQVLREHAQVQAKVEAMAPALGERLARLWNRANDRAAATLLETYVERRPDAADLEAAVTRLMRFYAGAERLTWERLSPDAGARLAKVAKLTLERFPARVDLRPGALVARALGLYATGFRDGGFDAASADAIRGALGEVLSTSLDETFLALAAEGLVRTDVAAGRMDVASERYRSFRTASLANGDLVDRVRDALGVVALQAGGLPEFAASAIDGGTIDRATLRGKVVVVDFWATWCRPCVEQLDTLRRIRERHGEDVVLIGVNMDLSDDMTAEALAAWMAQEGVPGRQIRDGLGWDSPLVDAFGVEEIPFSVVAGPDGAVLAVNEHGKRLEKAVQAAVRRDAKAEETRASAR